MNFSTLRSKSLFKAFHHTEQQPNNSEAAPASDNKTLAFTIIFLHLSLPLLILSVDQKEPVLERLNLSRTEFLNQVLITGVVFYLILATLYLIGFLRNNLLKAVGSVVCMSIAISFLLACDKIAEAEASTPKGLWDTFYVLLTERQALMTVFVLTLIMSIVGIYFLIKSLFTITYSGQGIQIKLPGQSLFYLPIYPQISWQDTGICIEEGDKLIVEISGFVSPGALQDMKEFEKQMADFIAKQKNGQNGQEILADPPTWPYTTAAGYPENWYGPREKLEVFKRHKTYKENYYYKKDDLLTMKGLPHNVVLGFVHAPGEEPPKRAEWGNPAYDWETDADKFLYLSSKTYPLTLTARKSGKLWVVINDVDIARWDNGGLFFLKLIKQ